VPLRQAVLRASLMSPASGPVCNDFQTLVGDGPARQIFGKLSEAVPCVRVDGGSGMQREAVDGEAQSALGEWDLLLIAEATTDAADILTSAILVFVGRRNRRTRSCANNKSKSAPKRPPRLS